MMEIIARIVERIPPLLRPALLGAALLLPSSLFGWYLRFRGALAIAAPYAFGETLIERRSDLVVFVVVTVFFGIVMGHSWFREE